VAANLASGPVICPAVASSKRPKPPKPTEADLQARLDAARMRVREIVMLRMKSWLSQEARDGLLDAEDWRRDRVRLHYRILAAGNRWLSWYAKLRLRC
jgi:hypothetical protein